MRRTVVALLATIFMFGAVPPILAQTPTSSPQSMTKQQIVERVGQIDRQLLLLERQELIKQFQEMEAKEATTKPKTEDKKDKTK
jgi:hypothetical protein